MTIYLIFYIIIASFLLLSNPKNKKTLFFVSTLLFLGLLGLRAKSVGIDTINYVNSFRSTNLLYGGEKTDFGFEILQRFLKIFSSSSDYFLLITSILALSGVFWLIYKTSRSYVDSLFLFAICGTTEIFFLSYFTVIRQSISISFCLIAIYLYFRTNRKMLAYILLIFSVSIHASSLIVIPFVFLCNKFSINKTTGITIIVVSYIIGASKLFSLSDSFDSISQYVSITNTIFEKYSGYVDKEMTFGLIENTGFLNMYLLPFALISIFILATNHYAKVNIWYFKLFYIGTVMNNLLGDNLMWGRLILYFTIFSIIVIPNMIKTSSYKYSKLFYWIIILFFIRKLIFLFIYLLSLKSEYNLIIPYKSWLFS